MAHPTDKTTSAPIYQGAPRAGLRNVGSYQVSGHPYVTGSIIKAGEEVRVQFPNVTKKVTVIGSGSSTNDLRIYFVPETAAGYVARSHHYISLDSHEDSIEFDIKCKEIYLKAPKAAAGYQLYASLTFITSSAMFELTGSGIDAIR
jgi:hypothetical protein|tara:strand:+ start:12039 stop:12476 length:438 start_codon:yes stop_codon:yes gene_type:complete